MEKILTNCIKLRFRKIFIEVYLIYNIVLVSGAQQNESDVYMYVYIYMHIYMQFFRLYSIISHYKILNIVPCVIRKRQWHPTPVLLPRKSRGRRSLVGCSPWGRQSRTRLSELTFTFHFHALEKAMATHSSVLAWRIPGRGKPGGLPSLGSQRVGHD